MQKNKPNRKRQPILTEIGLLLTWTVLASFAYRVSLIEIAHQEYDPYAVLNVDLEASISEIRQAYHELSK